MNFLALPFLFPILIIAAIVLCPIKTTKLLYGCVTGFRKDIVSHMSVGERLRSFACVIAMHCEMSIRRRLGQISNAFKVAASWLVVAVLFMGIVVPGFSIGLVWGVVAYVIGVIYELAKETSKVVVDAIGDCLEAVVRPASRSCRA